MKKILIGCLVASLLGIALMAFPPGKSSEAQAQTKAQPKQPTDESSFWTMFRKTFSRPEPKYKKPTRGVTEVAGVRGMDIEGKLAENYNWQVVSWMENYQLNEDNVMDFLQSRNLGPYQNAGAENEAK